MAIPPARRKGRLVPPPKCDERRVYHLTSVVYHNRHARASRRCRFGNKVDLAQAARTKPGRALYAGQPLLDLDPRTEARQE